MPPTTRMSLLSTVLFAPFSHASALHNTVVPEHVVPSSCTATRTTWSILLSCAATLFACTWTAIHPNMPGLTEDRTVVCVRRLAMMILALATPEYVITWAIHQCVDAHIARQRFQEAIQDGSLELRVKPYSEPSLVSSKVPYDTDEVRIIIIEESNKNWPQMLTSLRSSINRKCCRARSPVHEEHDLSSIPPELLQGRYRWTLKHSFFAWMGGFVLYVNKGPGLPRTLYYPLTPTELLEFLKADLVQMSMIAEEDLDDRSKGDWLSKTVAVMQLLWFVVHLAGRYFEKLPTTQLEIDALAIVILTCPIYAFWWYKPKGVQRPVPVYWKKCGEMPDIKYSSRKSITKLWEDLGFEMHWFLRRCSALCQPFLNLAGIECVSAASVRAHRVPCLCGYAPLTSEETSSWSQFIFRSAVGALAGVLFGAIHCIAWNFFFPAYVEKMLWRIASTGVTVTPALAVACAAMYKYLIHRASTRGESIRQTPGTALLLLYLIITIVYIFCRLVILVIMFSGLRSPPAGVYDDICWASFIPHV